jgi:hypothetical protein
MAQKAYYQHRQYKQLFENYLLHRRRQILQLHHLHYSLRRHRRQLM